jgi:hypothetical protein
MALKNGVCEYCDGEGHVDTAKPYITWYCRTPLLGNVTQTCIVFLVSACKSNQCLILGFSILLRVYQ